MATLGQQATTPWTGESMANLDAVFVLLKNRLKLVVYLLQVVILKIEELFLHLIRCGRLKGWSLCKFKELTEL